MENPNSPIGGRDSVVWGKRKREEIEGRVKSDSGGHGDDKKKTRKVDVFEDTDGVILQHLEKKSFEFEGFNPLKNYGPHNPFNEETSFYGLDDSWSSSDVDDESKKKTDAPPFDTTDVIKYITQGFDVDVLLPAWLATMCQLLLFPSDRTSEFVNKIAKVAMDEINVDMESLTHKSQTYELVEVAKSVTTSYPYLLSYLTLTVKNVEPAAAATTTTIQAIVKRHMNIPWELLQWRFKPDADAPKAYD
ncbi:uncharacterized protein LOC125223441 isoform X2 [Salvia hispanica]|uniref:uncharacterized protein LOC125223441 isoform X2 n=1 Tax=Salvia hispanica TaxID=49212 RepID=UPI00200909ED|nr:uncharacterized protein LOC125223441 isoform X2 [Salvia hispanica]